MLSKQNPPTNHWTLDLHLMFNVNIYFHMSLLAGFLLILPLVALLQIRDVMFPYTAFASWMLHYEQGLLCRARVDTEVSVFQRVFLLWCKEFLNSAVYSVHFVFAHSLLPWMGFIFNQVFNFFLVITVQSTSFPSFKYSVICFIL